MSDDAANIWVQIKPARLLVSLPYSPINRDLLQRAGRQRAHSCVWNRYDKAWEMKKAAYLRVLNKCLDFYGEVVVYMDSRVSSRTQCDTRCVSAMGWECVCSCGGMNHKGSDAGFIQVGDTTLIQQIDEIRTTRRVFRRAP